MQGKTRANSTVLLLFAATFAVAQSVALAIPADGLAITAPTKPNNGGVSTADVSHQRIAPSKYILPVRSFSIPFSVDRQEIGVSEIRLYVIRPNQVGWELCDTISVGRDQQKFDYVADRDGQYLFATLAMKPLSQDVRQESLQAQLSVLVDTTEPKLTLSVDANINGEIFVEYAVQDASLMKEMLVRYITDNDPSWETVLPDQAAVGGRIQINASTKRSWNHASVELTAKDQAGNVAKLIKHLRRPRLAIDGASTIAIQPSISKVEGALVGFREHDDADIEEQASDSIALPASDLHSQDHPNNNQEWVRIAQLGNPPRRPISLFEKLFGMAPPATPLPSNRASAIESSFSGAFPSRLVGNPQELLPPPASPTQIGEGFSLNGPEQKVFRPQSDSLLSREVISDTSAVELVPETLPKQPAGHGVSGSPSSLANRKADTPAQAMRPIEETSEVVPLLQQHEKQDGNPVSSSPIELGESTKLYESQRADLTDLSATDSQRSSLLDRVPTRFSKGKRFSLDYELEAIGAQGADSIELYGTTDAGNTWQLWGSDPDRMSPFDIETQDIGAFGFRICVVGRNGLASPRPQSGELPDIVVVVDTERPQVKITGARYGEGTRTGSLVISYQCDDLNLPARPITLAFSDSIEGPWTTIVGGLKNEGQYIWAADPNLPRQLYLRIDAIDEAGNRGVYLLDQPIDTQGLAPRAKIRGFQPLSKGLPAGEKREATAHRTRNQF